MPTCVICKRERGEGVEYTPPFKDPKEAAPVFICGFCVDEIYWYGEAYRQRIIGNFKRIR